MRGIDPIPTPVGSHFTIVKGKDALATANREALTIIFIVPPGINTLANAFYRERKMLSIISNSTINSTFA
jgi:hypothetical protein